MIIDFASSKEVLKITSLNYIKLLIATWIFFYKVPQYIFPQNHIKDFLDRLVFNVFYMLISVIFIIAFLLQFRIFSYFTLILCFILLKAGLLYYFEKRNLYKEIKNFYQDMLGKFYDLLDYSERIFKFGKDYKAYRSMLTIKNLYTYSTVRKIVLFISIIYIFYEINIINFINISFRASDMPLYSEWVAFLHKNYLYADNLTIGAYFFGPPIIIFFLQLITNIDSTILFSLYPSLFFIFSLIGIYYLIYKTTESHNSAIFAIIIYGFYCLSPLSKYILSYIYKTSNPDILNLFGLKFYFNYYYNIPKRELIDISYIPFIRINSGLPYEMAFTFTPFYIYFYIMCFEKKENYFFILYTISLILIFTFHGGAAIYLLFASILILLNAIIFGKINLNVLKKGFIAVITATIIGNLWVLSILKYGIPQKFGIAAPMLDIIFKTELAKKKIAEFGIEKLFLLTFNNIQLIIYFLLAILYPLMLLIKRKAKFICSSITLFFIAVLIIYLGENIGLPRLVARSRCAEYLLLCTSLGAGYYFSFFENFIKIIAKKFTNWISTGIIIIFIIASIFTIPTWVETPKFLESLNFIQSNEVVLTIYKIKKLRRPYSWTVVDYVQSYSRVLDKGFHINVNNFIKRYSPVSKYLKVPTEYVYIFLHNIKGQYRGSGEYFFRWRKDINLQLISWINLYSKTHKNIRVFYESPTLTVYEIDNRNYMKYLYEQKIKNMSRKNGN